METVTDPYSYRSLDSNLYSLILRKHLYDLPKIKYEGDLWVVYYTFIQVLGALGAINIKKSSKEKADLLTQFSWQPF